MTVRPPTIVEEPSREDFRTWVQARAANWVFALREVYCGPFFGRHRLTFVNRTHVLKVPASDCGVRDNEYEARIFGEQGVVGKRARCELLMDADDLPILRMEKVRTDFDDLEDWPRWIDYVDCCQVGYSKIDGRLVAYDYGPDEGCGCDPWMTEDWLKKLGFRTAVVDECTVLGWIADGIQESMKR